MNPLRAIIDFLLRGHSHERPAARMERAITEARQESGDHQQRLDEAIRRLTRVSEETRRACEPEEARR